MPETTSIEIQMIDSIAAIPAADWDACANPANAPLDPFVVHRFLLALEESGSVGDGTGWEPRHLIAKLDSEIIGVMPLYAKGHSQGEYVFDHAWAGAYERAGGRYYPKLQSAIPFTPVTGRRLLVRDDIVRSALVRAAIQITSQNQVSSFHITFCTKDEYDLGPELGMMQRIGQQFHWENNDYKDFDEFLSKLSSRKRKMIRKERREAQSFGGEILQLTGDQIEPEHWDAFWQFYQDTGARKWGTPYLTREFFDIAQQTLREDILLVFAKRDGQYIAGALNFIGGDTLFGRYWGCAEDHPYLHFELCYYQAIDYAIAHRLDRVEAGAQGEHKLARGYMPSPVYSLHWIADEGFESAVAQFLSDERAAVDEDIEFLSAVGPFKKTGD